MNAHLDDNGTPTLTAVLNTTGTSIVRIAADPTTHRLHLNDGTTGTNNGPTNAMMDDNFVRTLLAVSDSNGQSIVTAYGDSSEKLLVQST